MFDSKAPEAAATMSGMKADTDTSANNTSMANSTPAIGALKTAAIPEAAPQASRMVRSLYVSRYVFP